MFQKLRCGAQDFRRCRRRQLLRSAQRRLMRTWLSATRRCRLGVFRNSAARITRQIRGQRYCSGLRRGNTEPGGRREVENIFPLISGGFVHHRVTPIARPSWAGDLDDRLPRPFHRCESVLLADLSAAQCRLRGPGRRLQRLTAPLSAGGLSGGCRWTANREDGLRRVDVECSARRTTLGAIFGRYGRPADRHDRLRRFPRSRF